MVLLNVSHMPGSDSIAMETEQVCWNPGSGWGLGGKRPDCPTLCQWMLLPGQLRNNAVASSGGNPPAQPQPGTSSNHHV